MGQLLQSYLAASLPALQAIVSEDEEPKPTMPPGVEGIAQPEGATTFPMGPEPSPMQGQPISATGEPLAPMATMPPPGAGAGPQPTFDTGAPTPAIPGPQVEDQPDRTGEFEKGENSFMGMAEKHAKDQDPKDIDNAMKTMEQAGVDIDAQHAEMTKTPVYESEDDPEMKKAGKGDPKKMTKQEKALILMEFGLNLMAASGTGEGTFASDIGQAGAAALGGHMERKAAREKRLAEAEDKKLERDLKRAQLAKAKRKDTKMGVGPEGNQVLIDQQTGEMTPILMDGKPVPADMADKLDFQIKEQAFRDAFGSQIKDEEELGRRAAAFAAGVRGIAFPELARADAALMMRKELEKEPKQKWPVGGKEIKWEDLTQQQKTKITRQIVDGAYAAAEKGVTSTPTQAGEGDGILGQISAEDRAKLQPGKIYTLSDGRKFKYVDGKAELVD